MGRIEIHCFEQSPHVLPPEGHLICPPGEILIRFHVEVDSVDIDAVEKLAKTRTSQFPMIENDIGKPGICVSPIARFIHAIEHLVVLDLIDAGVIPIEEINNGSIAATIPGTTSTGQDIALMWFRKGLLDRERTIQAINRIPELITHR